jgi:ATPase
MAKTILKIIPDTSVIIEGLLSRKIEAKELKPKAIIIHEAVLSELEHQANRNRDTGYLGLEEIKKLREFQKKYKFTLEYKGKRPAQFEITFAKSGEIDSMIRRLAFEEKATLLTADKVQALVAESKGIKVMFIEFEVAERKLKLDNYFDNKTMSVHLKESVFPFAKKGVPGKWDFVAVKDKLLTHEELRELSKEIVEEANLRADGFVEIQRKGSTIIQLGRYRIVITKPPFSDGWEITAVKPIKRLVLKDYKLSEKLKERVGEQAEGILIAGAPGHGKTTFAQALAEFYSKKEKIVKTVEAPRDLQLPEAITQLAISHGSSKEVHDVLLLSRPDYTIFDEMRNTEDFRLFADLRLSGVGMVGVLHATNPIDAIQRFIGRVELGVIPQVIDAVVFIENGAIANVLSLKMEVKVPAGMTEADLARPVVSVSDFETGKSQFEIYSYGEQTVVVPVKTEFASPTQKLASAAIEKEFMKYTDRVRVDVVSGNKAVVYVPARDKGLIIGPKGTNIEKIEKYLGISIDVQEMEREKTKKGQETGYEVQIGKKNITFLLDPGLFNKEVDVLVNEDYLLTAKVGKKGKVRIRKDNKIGRILQNSINAGEEVKLIVG